MKPTSLKYIATECGVSIATVSKALNHCPGVSSATREQILRTAALYRAGGSEDCQVDLYIMLPELPTYFWNELNALLAAEITALAPTLRIKYNRYTRINDHFTVGSYLDEAEALCARAILFAAKLPPELMPRLADFAQSRGVFCLLEDNSIPSGFFFGSDHRANGRALASLFRAELPQAGHILAIGDEPLRLSGLREACGCRVTNLHAPPNRTSGLSAILARDISDIYRRDPFDAVVCLDGIAAGVVLALRKCALTRIPCYGVENEPEALPYLGDGSIRALVCQDLPAITRGAARAIVEYLSCGMLPERKNSYYAPHIVRGGGGKG